MIRQNYPDYRVKDYAFPLASSSWTSDVFTPFSQTINRVSCFPIPEV